MRVVQGVGGGRWVKGVGEGVDELRPRVGQGGKWDGQWGGRWVVQWGGRWVVQWGGRWVVQWGGRWVGQWGGRWVGL